MGAVVPDHMGVYVHLPWCIKKCPYCDFNSHEFHQIDGSFADTEAAYVDALIRDLTFETQQQPLPPVSSVFFGGGTPSLFSPDSLEKILHALARHTTLPPDCEITLEANPGTAEADKFKAFHNLGINRLSIGIQSFHDTHLKALGRIHNAPQAHRAIEMAQHAGFERINLDLMFGLPEQTLTEAISDVEQALQYQTGHLSHYQLTLEKNTWFYKHPPALPDADVIWEMQQACQELICENHHHYEVSAYASPDQQARHNLNYWMFGDYLGIGAGAHGKLTRSDGVIQRSWKHKRPQHYGSEAGKSTVYGGNTAIEPGQLPFEFAMNALRLKDGFSQDQYQQRTGLPMSSIQPILNQLSQRGLIEWRDQQIRCTERGWNFLNDTLEYFLPVETHAG